MTDPAPHDEVRRHRVILADDHKLVRSGLRALLEKRRDLEVIAELGNGRDAVRSARELRPDLVLMDVEMPDLNGIEATRQIASKVAGVRVLCLSMHASAHFVEAAFDAGAAGYLLKDSADDELIRAIRTVLAGHTYVSPGVADIAIDALRRQEAQQSASVFTLLTGREREVLQLLAEGCDTQQIADRLHLSTKTIYSHREQLMKKLGIRSVAGLTRYAIEQGLTSIELP